MVADEAVAVVTCMAVVVIVAVIVAVIEAVAAAMAVVAAMVVIVAMGMDVTMKDGNRVQMDEVCVFKVQEGRIVEERFFFT